MNLVFEILVAVLIIIGGVFTLIGSWGMVKLPELMSRLHAPTKATPSALAAPCWRRCFILRCSRATCRCTSC